MIYFFADNHYKQHPGRIQAKILASKYDFHFYEDDWSVMETEGFADKCNLLILNMIGDTCNNKHPSDDANREIRKYLEKGGHLLLLHGSSAAFWKWDWWRDIVGLRWVRDNDPDGVEKSIHPIRAYQLKKSKTRHYLVKSLIEIDVPKDEIYMSLEQVCPTTTLMVTNTKEGTIPLVTTHSNQWGGIIHNFLPGHLPEVSGHSKIISNISILIDDLIERKKN